MPLNARAAYRDTALTTAPPGRVLTMLYDRLVRDLHDAIDAIADSQLSLANDALQHAQEIVGTLNRALDVEVWPAARGLAQIYDFLARHLVTANLRKSTAIVQECLSLVEPLGAAWHEAYASVGSAARSMV